jgi:hypothetical protein
MALSCRVVGSSQELNLLLMNAIVRYFKSQWQSMQGDDHGIARMTGVSTNESNERAKGLDGRLRMVNDIAETKMHRPGIEPGAGRII